VLLGEIGKLVVSSILYFIHRWEPLTNGEPLIQNSFSIKDALYLAVPGLLFSINNILVYLSVGHNELASFGVFRDTIIFFNAALWCWVFKSTLGPQRNLALCFVFVGLVINQITPLKNASLSPWVLLVLAMAATNAMGSVANEYAIKQNAAVDLNLQNAVLYSFCIAWLIMYILVAKPQKLSSVGAFFDNFDAGAWFIIILLLCAGLMVSRLLKYTDSVTKNVAASLRGPILVLLAPCMGLHSRLDIYTGLSAVVVGTAACYFLMQGRPKPGIDLSSKRKPSDSLATDRERSRPVF
jgi:hypothetical protein